LTVEPLGGEGLLKSMTGFGRGEADAPGRKITVELKAVNHRFSEIVLRLPRSLSPFEDRLRKLIQSRVARGRVDGYVGMEESGEKTILVKVDKALAAAYYNAVGELKECLGIEGNIKLKHLISLPGVLVVEEPAEDIEEWYPAVREAAEKALDNLIRMRVVEGEQLAKDLIDRVDRISSHIDRIQQRAPVVVEEYREKLAARLNEFLKESMLDPDRLFAETVIFAERSNITEEVVRLDSHLKQIRSCLEAEGSVGRKLDFLIQEVYREINTIASKANDLEINSRVVEVKTELEKIREQAQNIE